ncbi:MAG: CYTH domain-containing protein [Anaerolineae bacterium]|nr:CYTH domain-containing protein [Anaerolineae bacterium]
MPVEIEIKSLLGSAEAAGRLRSALQARGAVLSESSRQLNHYFTGSALAQLVERARTFLHPDQHIQLTDIARRARKASVRTRLLNDTVLLIVKASLDDTTSANGITRLEFEAPANHLNVDQLDAEVLKAGFEVQAMWSRQREAYQLGAITICLDKNAGYGWLAEFEIMADDDSLSVNQTAALRSLMTELGVEELPQERLERMFAHYNANWRDYYGTELTFTVD